MAQLAVLIVKIFPSNTYISLIFYIITDPGAEAIVTFFREDRINKCKLMEYQFMHVLIHKKCVCSFIVKDNMPQCFKGWVYSGLLHCAELGSWMEMNGSFVCQATSVCCSNQVPRN